MSLLLLSGLPSCRYHSSLLKLDTWSNFTHALLSKRKRWSRGPSTKTKKSRFVRHVLGRLVLSVTLLWRTVLVRSDPFWGFENESGKEDEFLTIASRFLNESNRFWRSRSSLDGESNCSTNRHTLSKDRLECERQLGEYGRLQFSRLAWETPHFD